jgi:metal-sulfur cluster biosynthetic enzyme
MDRAAIETTRAQVYEALHEVYDPELGVNILDLAWSMPSRSTKRAVSP